MVAGIKRLIITATCRGGVPAPRARIKHGLEIANETYGVGRCDWFSPLWENGLSHMLQNYSILRQNW